MAFNRPDLIKLRDDAFADIERIPGADARLAYSNLNVIAHMIAGAVDGLYGYLDWQTKQLLPDTSEDEYLKRHMSLHGVEQREAKPAGGDVSVSGATGTVILVGTIFVRTDGSQFATKAEVTLAAPTGVVVVEAVTAGVASNTVAGSSLTLVSPVAGLASVGTVSVGGLVNGSDLESPESARARLLKQMKSPSSGGAPSDYEQWALECAGVTRAWVSPLELGPGTVTLRFMRDGDVNPIPDAAEVDVVYDYIDERKSVTSELFVVAPVADPIVFQITLTPVSVATKNAVEAELRDLIYREGAPGQTLLVSHIREAISIAAGESDHVLISPTANVTHGIGHIPTFGSITWS